MRTMLKLLLYLNTNEKERREVSFNRCITVNFNISDISLEKLNLQMVSEVLF